MLRRGNTPRRCFMIADSSS